MALGLNRIWVRFGLWITAACLLTIASLAISMLIFAEYQQRDFKRHLPAPIRVELESLEAQDLDNSPRALEIYSEYWQGDSLFGESWSLLIGLGISLPFGMAAGFWISRRITSPLASMVEVAARVEQGNLSSRAVKGNAHGEMATMIDAFNGMVDSLEELESERLATAASISHKLRTPLTVLQARLHAICDGVIDASPGEMKTLLSQVEHLGRLVGDLHTLSMADAGQLSLRKERIDMAALVGDVVEQLHPQLQKYDMALSLDLPVQDGEGCCDIRADADRLRQITTNLINNAVRHAGSGHWLGIRVHSHNDEQGAPLVVLEVSDAGPGLADGLQERAFQRFAQPPGKRRREGSGLGLSIVKALVTSQGGTVNVGASSRGGAKFTVSFARITPNLAPLSLPDTGDS
ncbi:HAMP domain-containing protein [Comamonas testosteroni]|uniref:histidine kinase n=1 Tax=Comamonas testosteroni TaxID=285 RepID=A0A373FQC8_COMTE|nr:ATP-binding protein [Comamonas testosteroni]RGE46326.1 HAMP domain-containing protein [Comamonas testosteroni]